MIRCSLVLLLAATASAVARPPERVVAERTLEAALGQPMVNVQLQEGRRVLTGRPGAPAGLDGLLGSDDRPVGYFPAYLDTGASAFVISRGTAERFGVQPEPDAVYHEVGLRGEVAMGVSRAYRVLLAGLVEPGAAPGELEQVLRAARLQLNRAEADPMLALLGGAIDVIGMPAIRKLVVEIDPGPAPAMGGGVTPSGQLEHLQLMMRPPAVHLHSARRRPGTTDLVIPLEYMDYHRRHPDDRGPRPELAPNPVVSDLTAEHGGKSVTGAWLLDTGAAASIICTAWAKTLGLLDEAGRPVAPPTFTLPLGGIGGAVSEEPGFVIERLRIAAGRGKVLEYRGVHVIVRDIAVERTPGQPEILDGVLGMNLLLHTARGLADGMPDEVAPSRFSRIWIDGPRANLVLDLP